MRKLSMDELCRKSALEAKSGVRFPIHIILDNIRSMQNVGSVFRTADAFNAEMIWLCGITAQPPHRDIQKTALGATESVPWSYQNNTQEVINNLKNQGFVVFAVEQTTHAISLTNFLECVSFEKLALIFGNEVEGVQQELLPLCDGAIEIPQWGMKHSLNIAVATGIVLWEVIRPWAKQSNH